MITDNSFSMVKINQISEGFFYMVKINQINGNLFYMIRIWSPATYERSTTVVSYLWIGLLTEAKVRQPWVLEIIIITNVVEIIIYLVMIVGVAVTRVTWPSRPGWPPRILPLFLTIVHFLNSCFIHDFYSPLIFVQKNDLHLTIVSF